MKTKVLFIVLLVFVLVLMGTSTVFGQSEADAKNIKFYETCILNQISKCQAKAALKTSKSANLRSCAAVSSKKAVFFVSHKDMLIQEMLKKGMDLKAYKIQYYLNKRYFEMNQ
jgi:hypothetical protein